MASHQQVTAISSLKYHFRASQCCETEQICKYALSSFQVLVLGELMRWNIANNANIQMMSLLIFKCFPLSRGKKRKLHPFYESEENLCMKFFFSWKKSLERFETSPPDYLIVSTINHRLPETFRPSKFCNAHQRLWPTMTNASLKLCFCKGTLGKNDFQEAAV